jgi:GT2 family glycosyltransferase
VRNQGNLGYAGGNNVGIRRALGDGADYVCILNNDVTVSPDFLAPMLDVLQSQPRAGIATPMICEAQNRGLVWALGGSLDAQAGVVHRLHAGEGAAELRSRDPFPVDVASGAAMLAKREVFEDVGLLDEAFYLYFEETDWCLRARKAGYRVLAVPSSVVWHKVSATLGQTSPLVDYYMVRNQLRLISRQWSGAQRLRTLTRVILRDLLSVAAYTVKPRGGLRLPHRDARLLALRDAFLGRWGRMGADVAAVCDGVA